MNKLICETCGQPEHEGECITPNIDGLLTKIALLEISNESHRILNGELQTRIIELEALIPTKEEAKIIFKCLCCDEDDCGDCECRTYRNDYFDKLQKIAGK